MRFGERLIRENLITSEQLDEALKVQVRDGGRVGSTLVELGYLSKDEIAQCLGRHYGMPALLAQQFNLASPDVQARLPAELAACWGAVPIGRLLGDNAPIAIAVMDPLPGEAIEQLSSAMGERIVLAVASELDIRAALENVYGIPPFQHVVQLELPSPSTEGLSMADEWLTDFDMQLHIEPHVGPSMDAQLAASSSGSVDEHDDEDEDADTSEIDTLSIDIEDMTALDLVAEPSDPSLPEVDLDDFESADYTPSPSANQSSAPPTPASRAPAGARSSGGPERTPLPSPSPPPQRPAAAPSMSGGSQLGRMAIKRVPSGAVRQHADGSNPSTIEQVVRAIRSATDRDRVGTLVVSAMRSMLGYRPDLGLILIPRGKLAIGWKGFLLDRDDDWLDNVSIPLPTSSLVQRCHSGIKVYAGPPPAEASKVDQWLWRRSSDAPPAVVAVVPVVIDPEHVCVLYVHGSAPATPDMLGGLKQRLVVLSKTMSKAFIKLIRSSHR